MSDMMDLLRQENERLKGDLATLNDIRSQATRECDRLATELVALRAELAAERDAIQMLADDWRVRCGWARSENETLRAERDAAVARAEKVEAVLAEFEAKKATPENKFELMLYDTISERNQCSVELRDVTAERDALRAQLDEACEALEPFAKECDLRVADAVPPQRLIHPMLHAGELRRARAVLKKIKGGGE